ncbi:hypothetical protein [Brevibacterium sandarakinum]|uniref:hypothetical protein n=1 Tax=Brevibacterium sandarakinum TaxID=629680 RepID=UPI00350E4866
MTEMYWASKPESTYMYRTKSLTIQVSAKSVGGEPVASVLTSAPGNNTPIGGLKVTT